MVQKDTEILGRMVVVSVKYIARVSYTVKDTICNLFFILQFVLISNNKKCGIILLKLQEDTNLQSGLICYKMHEPVLSKFNLKLIIKND